MTPLLLFCWLLCSAAAAAQALEAEVKAVFLFNFAKYVEWPSAPPGSSATIRLCAPANRPFLAILQAAVKDEAVNGRPLAAVGPAGLDEAKACDILYVGNAASADATAWLAAVRGRETLTVGDGRLVDGLVIAFVRDRDRVRFDIDRGAAERRSLTISSKLLRLARQVREQ